MRRACGEPNSDDAAIRRLGPDLAVNLVLVVVRDRDRVSGGINPTNSVGGVTAHSHCPWPAFDAQTGKISQPRGQNEKQGYVSDNNEDY